MNAVEKQNIVNILNDMNIVSKFEYLYYRWQDEKQYEDFNEYVNVMMKFMPIGATLIKGTKRPFGVNFKYGGDTIHIYIKFESGGRYCKLVAKLIKG